MDSGVTWEDIQKSLGRPLTESEQEQVTEWISEAEDLIESRLGANAVIDPKTLKLVVKNAVLYRLERAKSGGTSSITVSVDDANVTRRYGENDKTRPSAFWWFLDEWWELLSPIAETDAFTIKPWRRRTRALDAERRFW